MYFGYIFLFLAVIFFLYMQNKNKKKSSGWSIIWSQGTPAKVTTQGNGWFVDIPLMADGYLGTIMLSPAPSLKGAKSITLRGSIVGSNFIVMDTRNAGNPPTATFILQRRNDAGTGEGEYESYRWYSSKMIPMVEGPFELTVELSAKAMGGVNGGHDQEKFDAAVNDLLGICIGFGSAGGRAHSLSASVPSRFILDSYVINR